MAVRTSSAEGGGGDGVGGCEVSRELDELDKEFETESERVRCSRNLSSGSVAITPSKECSAL